MLGVNKATEDRGVVELNWDDTDFQGEVSVEAINPDSEAEDKDLSTKKSSGTSVVYTYPKDYSGTTVFTLTDSNGNSRQLEVVMEGGKVVSETDVTPVEED